MEQLGKSRWEGNEHWFKFDHHAGLKRFEAISTLGCTATAVALRTGLLFTNNYVPLQNIRIRYWYEEFYKISLVQVRFENID